MEADNVLSELMQFCANLVKGWVFTKPLYRAIVNDSYSEWAKNKNVYKFSREVLLKQYGRTIDISELFYHLRSMPFKCIYIETEISIFSSIDDMRPFGFWALKHSESDTEIKLLITLLTGNNSAYPLILPMYKYDTIDQCIIKSKQAVPQGYMPDRIDDHTYVLNMRNAVSNMLSLLQYVCENNCFIEENRVVPIKSTNDFSNAEIVDWDVSYRYITSTRRHPSPQEKFDVSKTTEEFRLNRHGSHSSPKPHIRCGHWKHVWSGKRSNPGLRKSELKWISETYVNKTEGVPATLPVVIREITG